MPAEQFLARSDRAGHGVDVHVSRSGEPVIGPRTLVTTPALLLVVVLLLVPGWARAVDFKLKLPTGLQEDAAEIPDDNPISPEKIALGKKFYWDKRWSVSKTVACVSCHRPDHGWSDPRTFSTDFAGKPTPRHAPTIVNRLFSDRQHWTGQRASLEEQAGAGRQQDRREGGGTSRDDPGLSARVSGGLRARPRSRRRGPGHRHLCAYDRIRELTLRSRSGRRPERDVGGGSARVAPVRGQGHVRAVPRGLQLHRRGIP